MECLGKHNFIACWVAGAIAIKVGNALVYPTLPFAITGQLMRALNSCAETRNP